MEQTPSSAANCHSVDREIHFLWKKKAHLCIHNSSPLDTIFSHVNRIHILVPQWLSYTEIQPLVYARMQIYSSALNVRHKQANSTVVVVVVVEEVLVVIGLIVVETAKAVTLQA